MITITDRDRLLTLPVYPGMDANESRVLRQFIAQHFGEYAEWRFMVRIGPGSDAGADVDASTRRGWLELTKARCDCVAFNPPASATIIEAKDVWTNQAVWQLRDYRDLYASTNPGHTIALAGVARDASESSKRLASSNGIRLFLYRLPPPGVPDVGERAPESST